ncbi:FMN-binding protein [Novosphingobium olei]|uniref:FMN-binding protein n=1 Tax=Novosphingobium olei TaxID=2728851 RepID=A0A7Y0BSH5_9SPHN|nr:FMN-binding protein [Novosphingobium olei]NML95764.1 FMN-binding protein [Novosphingobium olei]
MARIDWISLLSLPALMATTSPAFSADYLTVADAQRILLPQAQSFAAYPVTLNPAQMAQIRAISGVAQRTAQPRVWRALVAGRTAGWVIVDEVVGKHEFITYATGITADGHVTGVEILSYRETKGGQVRDPRWRGLFRGKTVKDKFKLNQDIPNISGATLSCRNITDGVKRLLAIHAVALAQVG